MDKQLVRSSHYNIGYNEDTPTISQRAARIWDEAATNFTPAEEYFGPRWFRRPPSLRYAARCYHPRFGESLPAIVAALTDPTGKVLTGVYCDYYVNVDNDPRPDIPVSKRVPQIFGTASGSAVQFEQYTPGHLLIVTENLQQALVVHGATNYATVWVALDAAGFEDLKLPDEVRHVLVLPATRAGFEEARKEWGRITFNDDYDHVEIRW